MSKDELRTEINKELEQFSEVALEDILTLLRNIRETPSHSLLDDTALTKVLTEDKSLLDQLAQ